MPNGQLHTGKTHTSSSERLFHFDELSKEAQKRASKNKEDMKKPTPKKKAAERKSFKDAVEDRMKDS